MVCGIRRKVIGKLQFSIEFRICIRLKLTSRVFLFSRCRKKRKETRSTIEVYFDEKSPQLSSREEVLQEVKALTDILQDAHKK